MSRYFLSTLLLLVLLLMLGSPRAQAETYNTCTGFITSVPTIVSTQGTWCLKQDLATAITSGAAITINTNNVTIDCNNFKLGGLAAGIGTSADGIDATDRANVTVRHCNIRGFFYGLKFIGSNSAGHAVEDNRFDSNTYVGLFVQGDGSVVQRNRVFNSGQTTIHANAYGIASADSVDIFDNTVSDVIGTVGGDGYVVGIQTQNNPSGRILRNGVRGVLRDGIGQALGIDNFGASDRITVAENDVVGDTSSGSIGIRCVNSNGRAKDNVVNGFPTGINACGDAGGNDVTP